MTLTVNLSPEAETLLADRAHLAGMPMTELITDILEEAARSSKPNLFDEMQALGVIGAVAGTSGPADGRAWSEIEAACDPL